MVDKGIVLGKLTLKYKGKSLSKNFIEKTAEKYAAKIADGTDDAGIDEFINDRDDLIQEAISETDRRVTEAVNKVKKPTETEVKEPKTDIELPADTPEWAKAMMGSLKAVSEKVNGFEQQQQAKSIAERFQSDPRLKGLDPKLLKGRIPTKEEDFEAAITETAEDLKDFVKSENTQNQGTKRFGNDKPNFSSNGKPADNQQKPELKEALDQVKAFTDKLPGNKETAKV